MNYLERRIVRHALAGWIAVGSLWAGAAWAGHSRFPYVDGGQSANGRFVVTAERLDRPPAQGKGPSEYEWRFTWKDTRTNDTFQGQLVGLKSGSSSVFDPVHAHLFVAPDGETFAVWNPNVLARTSAGDRKAPADLRDPAARRFEGFGDRLVVYRKTGQIVKRLHLADFLLPADWDWLFCYQSQVYWQQPYPGLQTDTAPRPGYALYRVSPDYTVLETLVGATEEARRKAQERGVTPPPARKVRVSLLDGRILAEDERLSEEKTPGPPFLGALGSRGTHKDYVPSLDPVRVPGSFKTAP